MIRRSTNAFLLATFFFLVCAGSLVPAPLQQQTEQKTPAANSEAKPSATDSTPVMALKVTTRLVVVTVVAHDKKGHVIPDLTAADFKITEDGKEQKISVFSYQAPREESPTPVEPPLPPNVYRNKPTYQSGKALNILLVDALNTNLLNQAYVRTEMVHFLEKLPQGQPIAIFTMGRKLRLVQDFTTDLTELKKVIKTMKGERSHLLANASGTSEVPLTLQGIAEQTLAEKAPQLKARMESFAEQDVNDQNDIRVQYTAAALSALARMLAGYPGRKNLFWLSESIPFGMFPDALSDDRKSPNSTLPAVPKAAARAASGDAQPSDAAAPLSTQPSQQASPKTTTQKAKNYTDLIIGISNDLADAQVSVYPVDARGLLGPAFFNVANNVSGQGAMGGLAQKAEGRQSEELFQSHYNMRDIAEKTGGMAYYNRNDLDVAVRTGMDDGATYYTLGYYPDNKNWDGQFRKIQVITPKNGAKLRYRAGYYAVDRVDYDRLHPVQRDFDLGQTLNPDYPVATALQFDALVTPPQPGKTTVRVQYAVDPKQISFQKGADGLQHAQLDCAARVFSPKNIEKPLKTEGTRVNAALQPEVFDKIGRTYFPCQIIFELPEGQYLLRLAVRDGSTGLLGSVNAQVTVPAAATAKKD